jgi:hypothetical protein
MIRLLILISIGFLIQGTHSYTQTTSCQRLYETVTKNNTPTTVTCLGSTMLVKVEYYTYQGTGYVVGYIKSNQYDYKGSPYIFCGISSFVWSSFRSKGMTDSWGKAFHEYIMNKKCNCH